MEPLEARHLIPLTEHYIHMNHAGVSPISERGRAAIEQVVEGMMSRPYRDHWAQDEANRVRELIAALINASPDCIALTRSTAHGMSLLAQGLDFRQGDKVIGADGEYPANVYPWMALERRGVEFRRVTPVGGRIEPDGVIALADSRTRVVALSHVQFWNGFRCDVAAIGEHCRRHGIVFALDVMQSVGALRVDARRMPIDYCAAGAGKWLMGPPGIGFSCCSAELLDRLQPAVVGVGSVVGFDQYFDYDLKLRPDARRFEESVVSLLDTAAFGAALEILLEVGVDVIENRVLDLSDRLADGLAQRGHKLVEPWPRSRSESSGIVSFRKRGASAQEVLRDLKSAQVIARTHRDFVRLSPHFYNTEEEIDRVLDVVAARGVRP